MNKHRAKNEGFAELYGKQVVPIGDRIALRLLDESDRTAGGLTVLNPNERTTTRRATVVAVGALLEADVKVGDTVVVMRNAGFDLDDGISVVEPAQILAVLA